MRNTGENKKARDYSREYLLRRKRTDRITIDIDNERLDKVRRYTKDNNITLTQWIKNKIDELQEERKNA